MKHLVPTLYALVAALAVVLALIGDGHHGPPTPDPELGEHGWVGIALFVGIVGLVLIVVVGLSAYVDLRTEDNGDPGDRLWDNREP